MNEAIAKFYETMKAYEVSQLTNEDWAYLSRIFNEKADLMNERDFKINQFLKSMLRTTHDAERKKTGHGV